MTQGSGVAAPRFNLVFYDLDGTLVDSRPGIEASLRAAFAAHAPGVEPPPLGTLLGQPLAGLLRGVLPGLDRATLAAVAATFTEHYDADGWRLSRPYPGVPAALRDLAAAGVRQVVLTNKRLRPTTAILSGCDLAPFLERVFTPDSASPPYPDKAAMARAARAACAAPGDRLLVIGDSADDLHMADACHAAFAAAAYGYGDAVAASGSRTAGRGATAAAAPLVLRSATEIVDLVMPAGGPAHAQ
jgi:phosphoglycolate phosphatase